MGVSDSDPCHAVQQRSQFFDLVNQLVPPVVDIVVAPRKRDIPFQGFVVVSISTIPESLPPPIWDATPLPSTSNELIQASSGYWSRGMIFASHC